MENEIQPNILPVQPLPQTPTPVTTPATTNWSKILLFMILGLVIIAGLIFIGKNITSNHQPIIVQPTVLPTQTAIPASTTSPTIDTTVDWKTYTNTAGYSIKYPASFTTQLLADGADNKEVMSTARNLFIYKAGTSEPYIERYINLEIFDGKPIYSQGIITEVILDNRTMEKIVIPDAKFDIYSTQVSDKEFIEIYVSNDPIKKEIANQLLSTFKFVN